VTASSDTSRRSGAKATYPMRGAEGVRTVEFREELPLTATGKVLKDLR
jgi:hypothetical protein